MVQKLVGTLLVFAAAFGLNACDSNSLSPSGNSVSSSPNGPSHLAGPRAYQTAALIFAGTGTSVPEANNDAQILQEHGLSYRIVDSAQLNAMTLSDLSQYGMIVWPGGYAAQMSDSLTPQARETVREAVVDLGVSYVGFCAGSFIAVSPAPPVGGTPAAGLAVINDQSLPYYYLENQLNSLGKNDIAMVTLSFAPGSAPASAVTLWYGGPSMWNWPDSVVAKYDDGTAAISQLWSGHGFVVLSAVHPEAPDVWKTDNAIIDPNPNGNEFPLAWQLFSAALNRQPMKTF